MRIQLTDIPQGHSHLDRAVPTETLDLSEWVVPRSPADVSLDADRRGDQITLRGEVRIIGERECGRCATEVPVTLEAEFILLADRRGSDEPQDEAALELDGSVLYHDGLELDLTDALREALILEIPVVTLCQPECAGLCAQCGQNKNVEPCSCAAKGPDGRWDALRKLKDQG